MTDIIERCDRCGAAGQTKYLLASGGELVFCLHHGKVHADKLAEVALLQEKTKLFEDATAVGVRTA